MIKVLGVRFNIFKVLLFVVLLGICEIAQANKKIELCIENNDYKPYLQAGPNGQDNVEGILIDIVVKSAQQADLQVKFVRFPWLRCQSLVKSGELQGLLLMIKTPERQTEFAFPDDPQYMYQNEYPIIVKKNGPFDTVETNTPSIFYQDNSLNINTYRTRVVSGLSAPFGYVAYQFLQQQNLLSPVNADLKTAAKLIENGRLDGYVIARSFADAFVKQPDVSEKLSVTSGFVLKSNVYAPFNLDYYQKNKTIVSAFWQALHENRPHKELSYLVKNQNDK
ncbi:ABC transporter substrate-binding protein [Paraglaciecola sp. L3A3]|uniref:substrate-binding periplasmic protein n=1 Tax=Paraglaciecola sp. L3A3 TaxID=2686358 RepID=UPI00131BD7A3|nr:transporter substrate-binding domain-containing protein [Paraglaciecola sp. L3A3]